MYGLKLKETNVIKIIDESLSKLSHHNNITVAVKSYINNEVLRVDHEKIVTVFFNLEQNAVEAMSNGGLLTVTVEGDEQQVIVTFADTGTGITEENIQLLFTPFFTSKPSSEGTGLSLPSAYATVKAHCGHISIESNAYPHKGTTGTKVKILLPRRPVWQEKDLKVILHEE